MAQDFRLRVTRLITWLPVGGIERRLVAVLPRLCDRGFDVRLVCLREYGALACELRDAGVPVDLIALRSRLDPRGIRQLARYLEQNRTQILHAHMYRAAVPGTIAARMAHVPVIFSQVHNVGTWESARQVRMDRFLTRWRTGVICVSRAVQDDVCRTLGLDPARAPVLYNGVDTDLFRPDEDLRRRTRGQLALDDGDIALLVPARLHLQKNPLGVLRAFARAREQSGARAVLLYAGGGPMHDPLSAAIDAAGLADCVRLLGKRDDMAALYNAADAVVLSTLKEGFSNAVVEALACGRFVIAADVGGNREAIDSERVGWIHTAGDEETLARQLADAMRQPQFLRERAGDCRARAMHFSLAQLVEQTATLYREAFERTGGGATAP